MLPAPASGVSGFFMSPSDVDGRLALISLYGGGGGSQPVEPCDTDRHRVSNRRNRPDYSSADRAAVVSSERETGTFELLRMTPLRSGQIFSRKLACPYSVAVTDRRLSSRRTERSAIWTPDIFRFIFSWADSGLGLLATIFCCTAGLLCSILMPQTARATVAGYVVTSTLFFVPVLAAWAASHVLSENVTEWIAMPSPLFVALNLVDL